MGYREFSGDDCRAGRALCCCRVLHQTWLRPINSHAAQPVHGTTRHGYTFAAAAGRRCPESSLTPNTACLSIRHKRSFIAFDALNFETGLLQLQQSETGLCCFTAQSTTPVLPFNRRCMSTAGGGAGPQVIALRRRCLFLFPASPAIVFKAAPNGCAARVWHGCSPSPPTADRTVGQPAVCEARPRLLTSEYPAATAAALGLPPPLPPAPDGEQ